MCSAPSIHSNESPSPQGPCARNAYRIDSRRSHINKMPASFALFYPVNLFPIRLESQFPRRSVTGTVKSIRRSVNSLTICMLLILWLRQNSIASSPVPKMRALAWLGVHPAVDSRKFNVLLFCNNIFIKRLFASLRQRFFFQISEFSRKRRELRKLPAKAGQTRPEYTTLRRYLFTRIAPPKWRSKREGVQSRSPALTRAELEYTVVFKSNSRLLSAALGVVYRPRSKMARRFAGTRLLTCFCLAQNATVLPAGESVYD
jgi:hypothetical protein